MIGSPHLRSEPAQPARPRFKARGWLFDSDLEASWSSFPQVFLPRGNFRRCYAVEACRWGLIGLIKWMLCEAVAAGPWKLRL
jgi:hypothetical protein